MDPQERESDGDFYKSHADAPDGNGEESALLAFEKSGGVFRTGSQKGLRDVEAACCEGEDLFGKVVSVCYGPRRKEKTEETGETEKLT